MNISEYKKRKAFGMLGLVMSKDNPNVKMDNLTFVNDIDAVRRERIKEYNIWYKGDSDEILNYYTRANSIEFNYDPIYNRNKKSYYWAVSSTEEDTKRTHTGIPRAVVDTLVNIVALPTIKAAEDEENDKILQKTLKDNRFNHLLLQEARPMTYVEGWGAWKIDWDTSLRDTPILRYYHANNVDFYYKSNTLCAIIYTDYYTDFKGNNYILFETRRLGKNPKNEKESGLVIEKDVFKMTKSDELIMASLKDIPFLKDIKPLLFIKNYHRFLGYPNIYFEDPNGELPGRSIFTGKLDYFDDADQCASQAANAVRLSTPITVFNTLYLERDQETGMPIMPKSFDKKYVMVRGQQSMDGTAGNQKPVEIIQPQIDFMAYSSQMKEIFINILQGELSPASFGIDVSLQESAAAVREKEKITIYTRNGNISEEKDTLDFVCSDLIFAYYLMRSTKENPYTGPTSFKIDITYVEFADTSFEHKLDVVGNAMANGVISPESAVEMLYASSNKGKDFIQRELDYINGKKEEEMMQKMQMQMAQQQQAQMPQFSPEQLGEIGAELGGNSNNPHNNLMQSTDDLDNKIETKPTDEHSLDMTRETRKG